MKTLFTTLLIAILASSAQAGILKCTGEQHTVEIDSELNTIKVSPEMSEAAEVMIADGPEEGLKVAADKDQNFLIFLKIDSEQTLGNLQSAADEDLEEAMTCEGSL